MVFMLGLATQQREWSKCKHGSTYKDRLNKMYTRLIITMPEYLISYNYVYTM